MSLETALKHRTGKQTLSVEITVNSVTYYIGTDVLRSTAGQFISYYPGLVSVTSAVLEGGPGVSSRPTEIGFAIRNDIVARVGTPLLPAEIMRSQAWIGAPCVVRVWSEDADGTWQSYCIFTGRIDRTDITRQLVEVRARVVDDEQNYIPTVRVSPASLIYGKGNPEGEMPEGASGSGVPVCYGIFGPESLDMAYQSSGHQLCGWMGAIMAPLLGMKVPMVPMPLFVDLYWKRAADGSPVSQARFTGLALGANWLGLAGSNPGGNDYRLPIWNRYNANTYEATRGLTQMPLSGETSREAAALAENMFYFPVFTWSRDLDRACPFIRDTSDDQQTPATKAAENVYASCIDWSRSGPALTDRSGIDSKIWAIMAKRVEPDWAAHGIAPNTIGHWSGLLQAAALPAEAISSAGGTVSGVDFSTSTTITNPLKAIDNDLTTYATVPIDDVLTLVMPGAGPTLGTVVAVRVCWLMRGPSGAVQIQVRHPGDYLMGIKAEFSCITITANVVQADPVGAGPGRKFGSCWLWKRREFKGALRKPTVPQWDFIQSEVGANGFAWRPEVRIEPIDAGCDVIAVWLEVIYKPNLYANDEERLEGTTSRNVWTRPRDRQPGERPFRWAEYNGNVPAPVRNPLRSGIRHYATGWMGKDLNGRWTGVSNQIICNPADIALHAIDYFRNQYSICETSASTFGSFADARAILDAGTPTQYRLAVVEDGITPFQTFLDRVALHAMGFIQKQQLSDGTFKWRMFVDTANWAGQSSRWWRGLQQDITKDDVFDIRIELTSLGSVRNRFLVRYGFHEPTRAFAYERQCTQDATNIASGGSAYVTACLVSVAKYGREVEEVVEFPWCWSHYVADQLLKWLVASKRDSRVSVRLVGSKNLLDIYPGHFVRLGDNMEEYLGKYPGAYGSLGSSWSSHVFNVLERSVRVESGMIMVELVLVETWTVPS